MAHDPANWMYEQQNAEPWDNLHSLLVCNDGWIVFEPESDDWSDVLRPHFDCVHLGGRRIIDGKDAGYAVLAFVTEDRARELAAAGYCRRWMTSCSVYSPEKQIGWCHTDTESTFDIKPMDAKTQYYFGGVYWAPGLRAFTPGDPYRFEEL